MKDKKKKEIHRLGGGLSVHVEPPSEIDEIFGFKCGKIRIRQK